MITDFSYGKIIVLQFCDSYVSFRNYKRNTIIVVTNGRVKTLPMETQIGICCAVTGANAFYSDFGNQSYVTYCKEYCILRKPTISEILELKYNIRKNKVRYNNKLKKFVDNKGQYIEKVK